MTSTIYTSDEFHNGNQLKGEGVVMAKLSDDDFLIITKNSHHLRRISKAKKINDHMWNK